MKISCPQCFSAKYWQLSDGRFRCRTCRHRFTDSRPYMSVGKRTVRKIVSEFVLEHSTDVILSRVSISKYKLLKILMILRMAMTRDVPKVFDGIVEVDETYLGGKWKNKRLSVKRKSPKQKRGRGTSKQPVFGILCRKGIVWAELIDGVEAIDLQPRIEERVTKGSTVCSDGWRGYTGIASKGYVHRLVDHEKKQYSDGKGNHINGLEGFWGYLKRKLAAKGGIRKKRIHLYLGEYVWRYNHRKLNLKERENKLVKPLNQCIRSD